MRVAETSFGAHALGLVLVLFLIWAVYGAMRENNPEGYPTTPTRTTTPPQPAMFQSSVSQPPQGTSPGVSQKTTAP